MSRVLWLPWLLSFGAAMLAEHKILDQALPKRPLTLAFVADTSCCLHDKVQAEVPRFARRLAGQLPERSQLALFVPQPAPSLVKEVKATAGPEIERTLLGGAVGKGGVHFDSTLQEASAYLQARPRGRIAMLVISGGSPESLGGFVQTAGFPVFVLSIGQPAEDSLAALVRKTGGEVHAFDKAYPVALATAIIEKAVTKTPRALEPWPPEVEPASRPLILGFLATLALAGIFLMLRGRPGRPQSTLNRTSVEPTAVAQLHTPFTAERGRLSILHGSGSGNIFDLPQKPRVVLGQSLVADIRLVDRAVAEQHCCVELVEGVLRLRALAGEHGTFVNGQPVAERILEDGDTIRIGGTVLRFSLG